jgi:hypothetical protein
VPKKTRDASTSMAWGGSCACGAGRVDICMQAVGGCGVPWDGVGFSETYAWCAQRSFPRVCLLGGVHDHAFFVFFLMIVHLFEKPRDQ